MLVTKNWEKKSQEQLNHPIILKFLKAFNVHTAKMSQ